jgi:hypothetical protein
MRFIRVGVWASLAIGCGGKETEDIDIGVSAESHVWAEYTHTDREDDVGCSGADNASAEILQVSFAQTHPMSPDWPFFFLVADRPALVEVVVTGEGMAPEVSITGAIDGEIFETLCMDGPANLSDGVDLSTPGTDDRFSVSLPAVWLQPGLSVEVRAGSAVTTYDADALGLKHAPELNLMLVMMDVVNYNHAGVDFASHEPPPTFLEDLSGAMPLAVTRLGRHAVRMPLPQIVVGSSEAGEGQPPVVLSKRLCEEGEREAVDDCDGSTPVGVWDVNAAALRYIDALQAANGHWGSHYYYGHTGALFPGGWGGGKTFVSADYNWVTIHELGHAASLPHWGDVFVPEVQDDAVVEYPWGGEGFDGGGRGPTWSYIQQQGIFVSPVCEVDWSEAFGTERSDAMQRSNSCGEWWEDREGPWDGFSDFSALAMFRYMTGASINQRGVVTDPVHGEMEYNLPAHAGFPVVDPMESVPVYVREDPDLPLQAWEQHDFLMPAEHDRPVFTIYGSYHPGSGEASILFEPLVYRGDLPRLIDPTDPATFEALASGMDGGVYGDYFWWSKDLTFRVTYRDGSQITALYPYGSVDREWSYGFGPWRGDVLYFGLNVPADVDIERIEIFERPFLVRYPDWEDAGNIANPALGITPENFMDDAVLVMALER